MSIMRVSSCTRLVHIMGGVDSGLVVVVAILVFLILGMVTTLVLVKYEWCHVLFRNNTVREAKGRQDLDEALNDKLFDCINDIS